MATEATALALLLALAGPAFQDTPPQQVSSTQVENGYDASAFEPIDSEIIDSDGYLVAHPDMRFRLLGNEARKAGRYNEALEYFQRAAHYADKLSQGAVAEMYWNGEGTTRDRALAYAWMDLAAERGARLLLAHRERYWSQLTSVERQQAIQLGEQLYAEFGDAVAKPRLEKKIVAARRRVTGSRVGWIGNMSICINPSMGSCAATVTGEQYYADRYWNPQDYWKWQDRITLTPEKTGTVDVGPLETMRPQNDGDK